MNIGPTIKRLRKKPTVFRLGDIVTPKLTKEPAYAVLYQGRGAARGFFRGVVIATATCALYSLGDGSKWWKVADFRRARGRFRLKGSRLLKICEGEQG